MKHTKGPWKVLHIATTETVEQQFEHVFKLLTPNSVEHDNAIGHATARLIASSPELLKALEDCLKETDTDSGNDLGGLTREELYGVLATVKDIAKAAIKKATE